MSVTSMLPPIIPYNGSFDSNNSSKSYWLSNKIIMIKIEKTKAKTKHQNIKK